MAAALPVSHPGGISGEQASERLPSLPPSPCDSREELPQPRDNTKAEFPDPACSGHSCSSSGLGAPWPEGSCPQAPGFGNKILFLAVSHPGRRGRPPQKLPCPVLSPELIPEILFHSTSTKSQAETRSHSKARPEPASIPTVWAAEALQRGQTAAPRARQGTQPHLTMEKQPDIPLRALDTLLLGYTHPNLIQQFPELLLC